MKSYTDIGHGEADAVLWALEFKRVRCFPVGNDTHASLWGAGAMNRWRGRYSRRTNELSIAPPVMFAARYPPDWLIDKIRKELQIDFDIWYFPVASSGVKIGQHRPIWVTASPVRAIQLGCPGKDAEVLQK